MSISSGAASRHGTHGGNAAEAAALRWTSSPRATAQADTTDAEWAYPSLVPTRMADARTARVSAPHRVIAPTPLRLVRQSELWSERRHVALQIKRATDVVFASLLLALSLPVLVLAALAIRLGSPGPIFFRQRRVGVGGREFTMFKLRTMCANAERVEDKLADQADGKVFFKKSVDLRITPVGRWLRRMSIDEIPQFYNVLRGDMSLVGPRPLLACDWRKFPRDERRRRVWMKPGLTGLWQVSGRSLCSDDERLRLDAEYVDQWSLALDLRILLSTPAVVLTAKGAF